MRPVFHYTPWRIQAHVTIAVLALLIERVAETRAGDTWRNIVAQLDKIKVVEYDRGEARIQQTTEMGLEAQTLLQKLKVASPPKVHSVLPIPSSAPTSADTDPPDAATGDLADPPADANARGAGAAQSP